MSRLNTGEKVWYFLVFATGAAVLGLSVSANAQQFSAPTEWLWLAVFTLVTFASLFRHVRLSEDAYHSVYTLDDVPLYALIFLRGWESAALVAAFSRLAFELFRLARAWKSHRDRIHLVHLIYHFSDIPLVVNVTAATGAVYGLVNAGEPLLGSPRNFLAILAAVCVWLPLAFGQNAICLTLRRQGSLRDIGRVLAANLVHIRIHVLMLVPLGALLAFFLTRAPLAAFFLVVPVTLMHNALQAQHSLKEESEQTIHALTHYLEARDEYTQGHSERVAELAVEIARKMGLSEADVDHMRRAGLIHDIGKVDIPDSILRKPGGLTADEKAIMRTHTDRAVALGRKLVALRRELPFREAAYRHENYDGSGHYQLIGQQIPLVSRVLAVADTFDAMTSDRPYRKGLPLAEALRRIQEVRGTQLDPRCVDAFLAAEEDGAISAVLERWKKAPVS